MLYTAILGFLPNLLIIQNASFNYMLYILYMSRLPIRKQCHVLLNQSPLSFSVNLLLKMGLINCAFRRVRNPDSRIHLSRSVSRQFTIIIQYYSQPLGF